MKQPPSEDTSDSDGSSSEDEVPPVKQDKHEHQIKGHTYQKVTIGGHAQVLLGDHNIKSHKRDDRKPGEKYATLSQLLDLLSTVLDFVSCAAPFVGKDPDIYSGISNVEVDHALITTALEAVRDLHSRLGVHRMETATAANMMLMVDLTPMSVTEIAEYIFHGVAIQAIQLADTIASSLEDLMLHGIGKSFRGFDAALTSVLPSDSVDAVRSGLNGLCEDTAIGSMLLLSSDSRTKLIRTELRDRAYKDLARGLTSLVDNSPQELLNIKSVFASATRKSLSGRLRGARKWLAQHHHIVQTFIGSVEKDKAASRTQRIRRSIMCSLSFPEMDARYNEITRAQAATFGWIYQNKEDGQPVPFANWLQNDSPDCSGLFWISGKPGSGKSTLMRFLSDDRRTQLLARGWAGESDLLIVKAFFWSPGTPLQKSQQGLLQSILYQLLRKHLRFSAALFPYLWAHLELRSQYKVTWQLSELQDAIFKFIKRPCISSNILLIVDGLDEYQSQDRSRDNEERQTVCDLLRNLALEDAVKVCTSSRSWNIYRDAFHDCPSFRLEDLTRHDIRTFIETSFHASHHFNTWVRENPSDSTSFVEMFIDRAQGVFLWVRLVVKSLLQGLQNEDDLEDLTRRLEEIPADLEEYFRRMMLSLDHFYLEHATRIFAVALSGPPQLLMLYYLMRSSVAKKVLSSSRHTYDLEHVILAQQKEERRVNATCMGFLEPIDAQTVNSSFKPGIEVLDFLHRTARDFMLTDAVQDQLKAWQRTKIDYNYESLKGIACLMRSCDKRKPWLVEDNQDNLVLKAIELTKEASVDDKKVWKLLDMIESEYDKFFDGDTSDSFVLRNALTEHHSYAQYVLQRWPNLPADNGRPWLDDAINSETAFHRSTDSKRYWRGTGLVIVKRLLALGADPNTIFEGGTIWSRFLERSLSAKGRDTSYQPSLRIMKLLIQHGAVSIVREGYFESSQRQNSGSVVHANFIKTPNPYTAMKSLFSQEDASELCQLLDQNAEGRWKSRARKFWLGS